MNMRIGFLAAAITGAMLLVFNVVPAFADPPTGASQEATTSLKMNASLIAKAKVKGQVAISATLATSDGKGVGNREVEFYEQVDLAGKRDAFIGNAKTDSQGVASLSYQAVQPGNHTVKARFPGGEGYGKADATFLVEVPEAMPAFEEQGLPLASVGSWFPYAIVLAVAATWMVLLSILTRTAVRIRAAIGPTRSRQSVTAPLATSRH